MKKWPTFTGFQKKKNLNCQNFMISFMIKYKGNLYLFYFHIDYVTKFD